MPARIISRIGVRWLVAALLIVPCYAGSMAGVALGSSDGEITRPSEAKAATLTELCTEAAQRFVPPTQQQLDTVRRQAAAAAERLEQRLAAAEATGDAWRDFLQLDPLREQLAQPAAQLDVNVLRTAFTRFDARHEGLNLVWFADLRDALQRYLYLAQAMAEPEKTRQQYGQLLEQLAERLDVYQEDPTAADAQAIGAAIGWLETVGQAPECVAAIRRQLVHPNLSVWIADEVIAAGIAETVDEPTEIRDVILGTVVTGSGRTVGDIEVELVPSPQSAVIDAVFRGVTVSDNVGRNGPVRIYSNSKTCVAARKRLVLHEAELESVPTVSDAEVETDIERIVAVRGGQLVERVAWKRACRNKPQAEAIASGHAENRVNRRIDQQTAEFVRKANRRLVSQFQRPLRQRRLYPQRLRFSTTRDFVRISALRATANQLAAMAARPDVVASPAIAVQVHESLINNFASSALAGTRMSEAQFLELVENLLGAVPEGFEPVEEKEPWAIDFASAQPLTVAFSEDGWTFTLRASTYYRGEKRYPGMNVSVRYKLQGAGGARKAVRQGELAIFPPGFDPEGDQRLSARQQVIRDMLARRFEAIFKPQMRPEDLAFSGRWADAGPLGLVQWNATDGWMVLAWKKASSADTESTAAKAANK